MLWNTFSSTFQFKEGKLQLWGLHHCGSEPFNYYAHNSYTLMIWYGADFVGAQFFHGLAATNIPQKQFSLIRGSVILQKTFCEHNLWHSEKMHLLAPYSIHCSVYGSVVLTFLSVIFKAWGHSAKLWKYAHFSTIWYSLHITQYNISFVLECSLVPRPSFLGPPSLHTINSWMTSLGVKSHMWIYCVEREGLGTRLVHSVSEGKHRQCSRKLVRESIYVHVYMIQLLLCSCFNVCVNVYHD